MFILSRHLKNKQRCIIKKLSTETKHRPTDHSSMENYVLPLITNWTSTSSEGTEAKTEEKWNFLFYFFSRGCEILLMSKLAIFTLSLQCLSEQSFINQLQNTFNFFCLCTEDTKTYICDHGFHKSVFTMTLHFIAQSLQCPVFYSIIISELWTWLTFEALPDLIIKMKADFMVWKISTQQKLKGYWDINLNPESIQFYASDTLEATSYLLQQES